MMPGFVCSGGKGKKENRAWRSRIFEMMTNSGVRKRFQAYDRESGFTRHD